MKVPESLNVRTMTGVAKAPPRRKTNLSKCGFEEKELAFTLIRNLGLKGECPALQVLITRKPVCRTLKQNRNTGDHIAVHEVFLGANSGF